MFTGLIEDVGRIVRIARSGTGATVSVATSLPTAEVRIGDSVAVNGICLTAVRIDPGAITFDLSPETGRKSTFPEWNAGMRVNLERALRFGDRLGGHLVTGHVDAVAVVAQRREESNNIFFAFNLADPEVVRLIVGKGSVAIDGVSLTVNEVAGPGFTVNVIPHTATATTLQGRKVGDRVNIETDIIGRYVERLLRPRTGQEREPGIDVDFLAKNGFL